MATDQEVGERTESAGAAPERPPLSRAWIVTSTVVGVLLVAWFFFAWLALDRHLVDAASEAVGSAFALLLAASVIGAVRRGQRG